MAFDGANKYCEESIEKLQQLAHYIKERKKIEEEYAHSLSAIDRSSSFESNLFRKALQVCLIEAL